MMAFAVVFKNIFIFCGNANGMVFDLKKGQRSVLIALVKRADKWSLVFHRNESDIGKSNQLLDALAAAKALSSSRIQASYSANRRRAVEG